MPGPGCVQMLFWTLSVQRRRWGARPFAPQFWVLEAWDSGASFISRSFVLLAFQKRGMGLKLERVNLYVSEPLLKPLKTVLFIHFPPKRT